MTKIHQLETQTLSSAEDSYQQRNILVVSSMQEIYLHILRSAGSYLCIYYTVYYISDSTYVLPLDGAAHWNFLNTAPYALIESQLCSILLVKLITADVSQCFPYNLQFSTKASPALQ